jgi:hypothetical protein
MPTPSPCMSSTAPMTGHRQLPARAPRRHQDRAPARRLPLDLSHPRLAVVLAGHHLHQRARVRGAAPPRRCRTYFERCWRRGRERTPRSARVTGGCCCSASVPPSADAELPQQPNKRLCQRSRHGPCSIARGICIRPRREGLARWNALGAARQLFWNGVSAPPRVTAGSAVALVASSSTSGVVAL